jgi:NitT/TauT family transport system substrate-binding protein
MLGSTHIRFLVAAGITIAACSGTPAASGAPSAGASGTAAQGQLPKPELTRIRIGISAPTEPVQFAEKLAEQLGFYQKYGIATVEITGFEGDAKALQGVVSGQLDMFVGGASTAINTVITDTPVKVISMNSVTLTEGLVCQKDIKTAADVKGKSIAISTFGGTSHGEALLSLQALNLTSKDAVITQVGNEGTRIAALKGGSIACAIIGGANVPQLTSLGMNYVVDLGKAKVQWGRSGLMARTDFIDKNPNTTLVVVAAALEAQNSIWADTKTAAAKFAEWTQTPVANATTLINDFLTYGTRSMMFTQDAFTAPREVLASVNPAVANVDVTKAFDLSFLKKLQDIGFNAKNAIPTSN